MSKGRELRSKMQSIKNTQKITRAMQMVATSKMRKTQMKMRQARPYAENIKRIIGNIAHLGSYARNSTSFLRTPEQIKNVGIIVITADKGLCGGLNSNTLKMYYETVNKLHKQQIGVEICSIGHKGLNAIARTNANITASAITLGDIPKMDKLIGPISGLLHKFYHGDIDQVIIIYSKFINTMKQQPMCETLLPLTEEYFTNDITTNIDYVYDNVDSTSILDELIKRYVETMVFQCLAENMASEQAARMVAMKSATDNAKDMLDKLNLDYNKSRQETVNKELSEIVGGSSV